MRCPRAHLGSHGFFRPLLSLGKAAARQPALAERRHRLVQDGVPPGTEARDSQSKVGAWLGRQTHPWHPYHLSPSNRGLSPSPLQPQFPHL